MSTTSDPDWTRRQRVVDTLCNIHGTQEPLPQYTEASASGVNITWSIGRLMVLLKASQTERNRLTLELERWEEMVRVLRHGRDVFGNEEKYKIRDKKKEAFAQTENYDPEVFDHIERTEDKNAALQAIRNHGREIKATKAKILEVIEPITLLKAQLKT